LMRRPYANGIPTWKRFGRIRGTNYKNFLMPPSKVRPLIVSLECVARARVRDGAGSRFLRSGASRRQARRPSSRARMGRKLQTSRALVSVGACVCVHVFMCMSVCASLWVHLFARVLSSMLKRMCEARACCAWGWLGI